MEPFRRQVPDTRHEPVAEQGCDGEDMVGETAGVGILLTDAPSSLGHQQPVEGYRGLRLTVAGMVCVAKGPNWSETWV